MITGATSAASGENDFAKQVATVFKEHSRQYGSRRICAELCAGGVKIGRQRVRRQMAEQGLRAIQTRSFVPRTTASRHRLGYSPNLLLAEKLPPLRMRQVVVSDITYLPLSSGKWAYLTTFTDLFSRRILAHAVAETTSEDLILAAARQLFALSARRRCDHPFGSRRTIQRASNARNLLRHKRCRQSMSRAGETYDNAFAESLFSRLRGGVA